MKSQKMIGLASQIQGLHNLMIDDGWHAANKLKSIYKFFEAMC